MDTMETLSSSPEERLFSPAAQRNRAPILKVLETLLPAQAHVLEIASGSGEHAVHFARALPGITWQPSDPSEQARRSIAAWTAHEGLTNVCPPLLLDATQRPWPDEIGQIDAIVCCNMIHIAPWQATEALLAEAGERLSHGGVLMLYGPFTRNGEHTAASNREFDQSLRARHPQWGIRDLENDLIPLAAQCRLMMKEVITMPANNISVVLARA
ncbi:class I SAM-dependent methyltransferase [Phytohalomonas tamaricis]|uniref:class I SAM-dependent methyltransferase n=1 Tax=Phytohalomonas tamaricis TaxID=2081032 RepID=UPI0021D43200|nr:class I SAM-dependent methyltransferase [Phytohalomonas tamaricis]